METKQKECEICGVWFTPSRSSQKYCPECGKDSTKAWRDLHKHMQYSVARVGTGRPVSKTEVECKYCHKTFTCYNGVTSAYCSKACEAADRIQNTFCACCGKPQLVLLRGMQGKIPDGRCQKKRYSEDLSKLRKGIRQRFCFLLQCLLSGRPGEKERIYKIFKR